jgi:hypothetical protein
VRAFSPEALRENRRFIVAVSVVSGIVGLLPIPLVGDLGIDWVRSFLVRRLARRRQLALSGRAALVLGGSAAVSPSRLALSTALVLGLRLAWRRLTRVLFFLLRFDDMARTFLLGTLFDYYCHRFHEGEEITDPQAEGIHLALQRAASGARQQVISALFRRALGDLWRTGAYLPKTLVSLGVAALRDDASDSAERVVEEDLEGFFSKITALLEGELSAAGQITLEAIYHSFDEVWCDRSDASEDPEQAPQRSAPDLASTKPGAPT